MSMIFALVLFGCADDGTSCQQLAARPEHYQSKVLCQADQKTALQSDIAMQADHPLVVSRCLRVSTAAPARKGRAKLAVRGD